MFSWLPFVRKSLKVSPLQEGEEFRLAIIACEPSADLHGALLVEAVKGLHPNLRVMGVGGQHMAQAGVELWFDSQDWSSVGPSQVLERLPHFLKLYWQTRQKLLEARPHLTVVIDAPAINMRLTGVLRRYGLRSAYYFPPSAWTRSAKRLRQIHGRTDGVLCTFKSNADFYDYLGLAAAFYGHPMVETLRRVPAQAEAQRILGVGEETLALLPGSRLQEIKHLLPVFLRTAHFMHNKHPQLQVLIPCATPLLEAEISRIVGREDDFVRLVSGQSSLVMAASRAVLMSSGTASLEAALLGVPTVMGYRFGTFDAFLGKLLLALRILRIDHIGLPNLVLKERVVPEFIQEEVNPHNLVNALELVWNDGPGRDRMCANLKRVQDNLQGDKVVEKLARVCELLAMGQTIVQARGQVAREYGLDDKRL